MRQVLTILTLLLAVQAASAQAIRLDTRGRPADVRFDADDFYIWFSAFHFRMAYQMLDSATQSKYDISEIKEGAQFLVSGTDHPYLVKLITDDELGTFLLLSGRASITHRNGEQITGIQAAAAKPIMLPGGSLKKTWYTFTDGATGRLIFRGSLTEPRLKHEH